MSGIAGNPLRRARQRYRGRAARVFLRMTWRPGVLLLLVLAIGTLIGLHSYPDRSFWRVLYEVLELAGVNPAEPFHQAPNTGARFLYFAAPLVGVPLVVDLFRRFFLTLQKAQNRDQEWEKEIIATMREPVIVCGLGSVGTRVLESLVEQGLPLPLVAIERNQDLPGVKRAQELGIPVLLGDGRLAQVSRAAGIERARLLVLAEDDDDRNIGLFLRAEEIRGPGRPIDAVFRCFDTLLSEQVIKAASLDGSASQGNRNRFWFADVSGKIAETMTSRLGSLDRMDQWKKVAIVGLGKVGFAVARYLVKVRKEQRLPCLDAVRLVLVDRQLAGTWAGRTRGERDWWYGATLIEKDLAEFLEEVEQDSEGYDVMFVTTGEDLSYFLCRNARIMSDRPTVVRTKYALRGEAPPAFKNGWGEVVVVNTTEIAAPLIIEKVYRALGRDPV